MDDPTQFLRRQFTLAALIDLAVILAWLGAAILRVRTRGYLLLALLTLGAAAYSLFGRHTAYYAPPAQQTLRFSSPAEFVRQHAVKPDPLGTIVRDIGPGDEDVGRWTNEHPAVQFTPKDANGWSFYASFIVVKDVLKVTGPQTVRFTVNGVAIDTKVFPEAGEQELRYKLDPSWIKAGAANTAGMDIAPALPRPDGTHLGVILRSMGFVEDLE